MENFTLWHQVYNSDVNEFSFYATAVNVQRIGKGAEAMIAQMLADMNIHDLPIEDWSFSRMATDYLSDDRDSEDWEDIWMDTCVIRIQTPRVVVCDPQPPKLIDTYAWDDTWSGEEHMPERCVVIADFESPDAQQRATDIVGQLGPNGQESDFVEDANRVDPTLTTDLLLKLYRSFHDREVALEVNTCHEPGQLHLSMPAHEEFFKQGADLAVNIRDLCEGLGGSTGFRGRFG